MRKDCRKSDRAMAMEVVLKKQAIRVMCANAPQVGRSVFEKDQFYNEETSE